MAENSTVAQLVVLATFTNGNIDIERNTHTGTEIEIEMHIDRDIDIGRHLRAHPGGALGRPGLYEGMNVCIR